MRGLLYIATYSTQCTYLYSHKACKLSLFQLSYFIEVSCIGHVMISSWHKGNDACLSQVGVHVSVDVQVTGVVFHFTWAYDPSIIRMNAVVTSNTWMLTFSQFGFISCAGHIIQKYWSITLPKCCRRQSNSS